MLGAIKEKLAKFTANGGEAAKKGRNWAWAPYFFLICLGILTIIAMMDYFFIGGMARRTIVFYQEESALPIVEERFVPNMWDDKDNIRSYIEEVTLGPKSMGLLPLLGRGTTVETFIYHNKSLLVGFSEEAFDGLVGEDGIEKMLGSITNDLQRNFPSIKSVKFFVSGYEVSAAAPAGLRGY